jgi:hypothetical protein
MAEAFSVPRNLTQAEYQGINTSNLYVNINGWGTGTLSDSKSVDQRLINEKVVRLLRYEEAFHRQINKASETNLLTAGQINASLVTIEILRSPAMMQSEQAFLNATCLNNPGINIFRVDVINGKFTIVETIEYVDCYFTGIQTNVSTLDGENLASLILWFRYNERTNTLSSFDEKGTPTGKIPTHFKASTGTLQPSGGPGGGGGGGGTPGGGGAPGGGGFAGGGGGM